MTTSCHKRCRTERAWKESKSAAGSKVERAVNATRPTMGTSIDASAKTPCDWHDGRATDQDRTSNCCSLRRLSSMRLVRKLASLRAS